MLKSFLLLFAGTLFCPRSHDRPGTPGTCAGSNRTAAPAQLPRSPLRRLPHLRRLRRLRPQPLFRSQESRKTDRRIAGQGEERVSDRLRPVPRRKWATARRMWPRAWS